MVSKAINRYKHLPIQVKASLWFLICSFLQKGISVITTPIFTRLLSSAEYGQYNVYNSWLNIISIFVTLNLSSGVYTQGLIKFSDDKYVFSSSLQGLSIVLVTAWTVVYVIFHNVLNELFALTTVQMFAMLVMIWLSAVFNFWAAEQRVNLKYRQLVLVTMIVSICKPVIGIIFVIFATDKVTARILGLMLVELIGYVWLFVVQMYRGKIFCSKKYWKYALKFNLPLVPHYLSQTVLNSSDRIMIKVMCGSDAAGIYSLAYSLSMIMTLFNTALIQTINPWIYQKIKDKKTKEISQVAYPSLIIIAAVNILLIAFAPEAVTIFAPKSYYDAIWVIPPVAMSVYFMFAYSLFANFEFYYEKTKYIAVATGVGAILNLVLNYIFIHMFGYFAAGYTTLLCYIIYAIFHYCFMNKICNQILAGEKVYSTKQLIKITVFFLTLGFVFLITYTNTWIRYALIALIMIAAAIKYKKIEKGIYSIISTKIK